MAVLTAAKFIWEVCSGQSIIRTIRMDIVARHELTRWLFSFLIIRLILWSVHKENAAKQFPTPVDFNFQKSKLENLPSYQTSTYPAVVSFSRGALIGMEEMESRLVLNNTSLKVIYPGKLFSIINWPVILNNNNNDIFGALCRNLNPLAE